MTEGGEGAGREETWLLSICYQEEQRNAMGGGEHRKKMMDKTKRKEK